MIINRKVNRMKVILTQDVKKVGKKGDVLENLQDKEQFFKVLNNS